VLYDAVVLPGGANASAALAADPRVLDFLRDQYRHGKAILALGAGEQVVDAAGLPRLLPDKNIDCGFIVADAVDLAGALSAFEAAPADHRVYARETAPPRV
jgi:catalase